MLNKFLEVVMHDMEKKKNLSLVSSKSEEIEKKKN